MITSIEEKEKPDIDEFQFPRRRKVAKIDSSICPWGHISTNNNRATSIALPHEDSSLTAAIQKRDKTIQPTENAAKILTGFNRIKASANQNESTLISMDKRKENEILYEATCAQFNRNSRRFNDKAHLRLQNE